MTQFGPYKLIDRISVGGMAEVYKAIEYGVEGFERVVAVKRILPHIAEDDEFITMFKDEAKIAGQLNHSNIAQIYNLGQQDDSFYIALEYVAGRDLRAIFTRCQQSGKPMPLAQACFIVMKVCEGLDYAHNKKDKYGRHLNIIHRDVSPPNVLVSYEGEVKLIDFGVAKAAGRVSRTQAGILKGKFGYMSPEQVRGMPLDRRSDIFSLGVVLYEVLTGVRLFQGDTDFATLEMVRTVDVPAPRSRNPEIPEGLEKIIMKGLSGEPETRYQTAMELHDDLQSFMFSAGMFYSRKDLAAWMRKVFAKELEAEKSAAGPPPPPPPGGAAAATRRSGPKPAAASKPPPPKPGPKPPPSIRLGSGPPKPEESELGPTAEQQAALRKRSKTMLMSGSRPTTLKPGAPPARPPVGGKGGLAAPVVPGSTAPAGPPARAGSPRGEAGADLDWDDDELETKLFDEGVGPGAQNVPAQPIASAKPIAPAQPIASAKPISQPVATAQPIMPAQPIATAQPIAAAQPQPQPVATAKPAQPIAAAQPLATAKPVQNFGGAATVGSDPMIETPGQRKLPLGLIAGIVGGVVLLIVIVVAFSGGGEGETKPEEGKTAESGEVAAAVGSLTIEVKPQDAEVKVDGQSYPGTSPRVVGNLAAGKHTVVVSKGEDFLPFEAEIDVAAGAPVAVPVSLQLKEVALTFEIEPEGAAVSLVEGETVTPIGKAGETFKLVRKPKTSYQIEAAAEGYVTDRAPLTFSGDASQTVKLALIKDPNAKPVEKPVEKPAEKPEEKATTTTKPKDPTPPKPKAAKTATLKIGTGPGLPPATVWVDGKKESKTTPVVVQVTPGSHKIKWKWPDGKTATQSVSVGDKESVVVKGAP